MYDINFIMKLSSYLHLEYLILFLKSPLVDQLTPLFFPLLCPVFFHFLTLYTVFWCSVAQSVSDFLQPRGLQHPRLPCPSLSPRVCSNSYPFSWWYHPTISSSVTSFSSWPYFFPASGSFPLSQLFASGGQSIVASVSVFLMNIEGWFSLGLIGLISLLSKGLLRIFSGTTLKSINSFVFSLLYGPSHIHPWQVEKP